MYQKVLVENNDLKRKMDVSSKHENLFHKSFFRGFNSIFHIFGAQFKNDLSDFL